jgi:aspartyl-tRNA(Asn)/glutamyl-tRNA(Gln) amidotransferase subunit C
MISKEQVQKIAGLSKLALSDDEITLYQKQLEDTLSYISVLEDIDTEGVEPLYALSQNNECVLREDEEVVFSFTKELISSCPLGTLEKEEGTFFITHV